jgi:hypothetical protein
MSQEEKTDSIPDSPVKAEKYENLKQFYFHDMDGEKLIMNIANDFKESNAILRFDDGTIWQVSYLGKVLQFLNNTIQEINMGIALSPVVKKWLAGELPVNINPQIEIGPHKIVNYAQQAIVNYPTGEYEKYIESMGYFRILFDNCEIVKNLRTQ